ncbi:MAG: ATP-binding protein [Clostridia bacterium]|nr:ATP-binding protein [Clostridia bacterium]
MQRDLYEQLLRWKNNPSRKPLVLQGARQVGKTYLIKEFGQNEFEQMIVLNCDKDPRVGQIFQTDLRVDRILSDIEILTGQKVIAGKTLLFIDEVGEAPRALAALKYFHEDAPQYHVIVAGSLLGLAIHQGISYPVGKTDEMYLYPLTFPEFVRAKQGDALYYRLIQGALEDLSSLSSLLKDLLREYYFTGGMPEVVREYVNGRAYNDLRNIQKQILADYALDISKHAPSAILGRIHQVWNSIPQQLVKQNSKFIYGDIQKGARAKDFELAIEWLLDAGIVYKISRVRKAGIPLKYYEDFSAFKLFLLDHGLMGAMVDAPVSDILLSQNVFEEYNGTFTEQYVFEQLVATLTTGIYFYNSETSKLELDFLTQGKQSLLPIEVKAGENLKSKSLKTFHELFPKSDPIRISLSDYRKQDWLTNIPLYAACRVCEY